MEAGIIEGTRTIIRTFDGDHYQAPAAPRDWGAIVTVLVVFAFIFFNFTRTVLYLALMPVAWLIRSSNPWLFDSLEAGRSALFTRLRKVPIVPLLIAFLIWMILPVFFTNRRTSIGDGSGGGFSGGGGFGGGSDGGFRSPYGSGPRGGGGGGRSGGGGGTAVLERIEITTADGLQTAWVLATNVYLKSGGGWAMAAHHASPGSPREAQDIAEGPTTIH